MKRHPAASSYARALLEVAEKKGGDLVDTLFEELLALDLAMNSDAALRVFFESPKIPRSEKKSVLEKVLSGQVSGELLNLLRMLIDRGRQFLFDQIVAIYGELYDDFKSRIHVRVTTAAELSDAKREQLTKLLADKLQREILLSERVNEELLGGMTIRFGDTVVDGSIRTQLNKVREVIASQRLGSDLIHEN